MSQINPFITESWERVLKKEFDSEYFLSLKNFLLEEKKKYEIFPPDSQRFSAFNLTPFENVKVVIIGQDPYHGYGQAHGLCFSVPEGVKKPPSLQNIFKEIRNDLGFSIAESGNLEGWAKQGVLLLNAILSVRAKQPGSHQKQGWEAFTNAVIKELSDKKTGLVFLLWGAYAQQKQDLIDISKHYVLNSTHPSPFSAYRGFLGCKHFSKTNEILSKQGLKEIEWGGLKDDLFTI